MFTQIYVNANYPETVLADWDQARRLQVVGLAHSVPRLDPAARHLALHPPADAGEPGLQKNERGRLALEGAADGSVRPVEERQDRAARPARPRRRPSGGLVHGQFYALFFLQSILKIDNFTANVLIAWALVIGTVGFLIFGALSDRIGRKPIILWDACSRR